MLMRVIIVLAFAESCGIAKPQKICTIEEYNLHLTKQSDLFKLNCAKIFLEINTYIYMYICMYVLPQMPSITISSTATIARLPGLTKQFLHEFQEHNVLNIKYIEAKTYRMV